MNKTFLLSAAALLALSSGCGKVRDSNTSSDTPETTSSVVSSVPDTTSSAAATTSVQTDLPPSSTAPAPHEELVMTCLSEVEVFDKVSLSEFVTSTNGVLSQPDELIDTSSTGSHEVTVKCTVDGVPSEKKITFSVVDKTAPLILNSGWNANHLRGNAFDLSDYVGYADNYDSAPVLTYTGNIDPNTSGSYPLTATVTDSSGNSASFDVTVNVLDYPPQQQPYNGEKQPFESFMARYAGEGRSFGIDVSEWQGDIDFNAVKNAGCSFVIMRTGYCYSNRVTDKQFEANFRKANEAGLNVGLYFYSGDSTEEAVREHARWIAGLVGDTKLALPVAFDWEDFGTFQEFGISLHQLNELYFAFADELEKCGLSPMLYSSKNFLNSVWTEEAKSIHPVWLAHYCDETDYTGDYAIWQGSCTGQIPGICGDVDMNVLYRSLPLE